MPVGQSLDDSYPVEENTYTSNQSQEDSNTVRERDAEVEKDDCQGDRQDLLAATISLVVI